MVRLLKEVLKNILSKPATIQYPYEETIVEPDYRGRHYADLMKCIGCSLCAIECPADAIKMEKVPDEYKVNPANKRRIYPVINYMKCVFCYRCITVCPTNAYISSNEYRLASKTVIFSRELSLSTVKTG